MGGWLAGRSLDELPLKLAAVSRCYRAETGGAKEEAGLYRVHQFTKVRRRSPKTNPLFLSTLEKKS